MRLRYTVAFIALLVFAVLALALWPPGVNSAVDFGETTGKPGIVLRC